MAAGNAPQFASLYVGDLHPDVTEAILYEIFNSVGTVGSIRVCRDSVTRRSLGYGYVNFHSVGDAERALETLNYSSIKGRSCRIMWCQRDPSLRKSGVGNIYVKNLDQNIDNKALYDTFSLFGNILSCKVACDTNGKSRGYGFVHYETEAAARQAIERVNGMQIGEKQVEVTKVVKRAGRDPTQEKLTNLYIKGLPAGTDEEKLKDMFAPMGAITSCCVQEDKQGRKFAFVNYEVVEDAQKAIDEMNGKDMRSPEEQAAANEKEGAAKEEGEDGKKKKDGEEDFKLYVGRAMSKAERARELGKPAAGEPRGGKGGGGGGGGVNLYVKNLDEDTDDVKLKELFDGFGKVSSAVAMKDSKGRCKGFGFVSFDSPSEATQAVTEMHLKVVNGKPLYVGLAEKREARQERLQQRYTPPGKGCGNDSGKGKGKGKAGGMGMGMGMGGCPYGAPGGPQSAYAGGMGGMGAAAMQPSMGAMGGGMAGMGGMGGMGGMMGGMMGMPPQLAGMMGKGAMPGMMCGMPGASMNPAMMGKGPMMMGGKGAVGMPPMMGLPPMLGKGGLPGGMPAAQAAMMGMGGMGGMGGMPGMAGMGALGGKGPLPMGMHGAMGMGMLRAPMPGQGLPQPQAPGMPGLPGAPKGF